MAEKIRIRGSLIAIGGTTAMTIGLSIALTAWLAKQLW